MIRIRALNDDSSDDEDPSGIALRKPTRTREVQEQEAIELYNFCFELVSDGKLDQALKILELVLDLPFLDEEERKFSPLQFQMKLGCLKTLSLIHYSLKPNPKQAVRVLKMAVALDPTNVTLWYRLGVVAMKTVDLELAFAAFSQGYECSSNHWGCLENMITLSYVLLDSATCLSYCALGLARDPSFIRGLVFRDHICRLQPFLKPAIEESEVLKISHEYTKDWETRYLSEAQDLLRLQKEKAEDELKEENLRKFRALTCQQQLRSFTFSDLCRFLLTLYETARIEGALLRPVQFLNEFIEESSAGISTGSVLILENGDQEGSQTPVSTRRNSLERDKVANEDEVGTDAITGSGEGMQENGDKSAEDSVNEAMTEKEQDDETNHERNKKKAKRDIKWWQLEGKRRSERVRGNLVSVPPPSVQKKEADFATKLRNIIPVSLLIPDSEDVAESHAKTESSDPNPSGSQPVQIYFGSEKETSDVQLFIAEHAQNNTMEMVIDLTRLLAEKSDREWPIDLATQYLQLYTLYRNHVPQPDPFSTVEFIQQNLTLECCIALTVLELLKDCSASAQNLKDDERFTLNKFFVSETCGVIFDSTLINRFYWFLANYHLSLALARESSFDFPKLYLEILEQTLTEEHNVYLPTRTDNIISLKEVQKKLSIVKRTENVARVADLYQTKKYSELIEILPLCFLSGSSEGFDQMNRFYLADSYFQLRRYKECHMECLNLIKHIKVPSNSQILQKTVILLKRLVGAEGYEISPRLVRLTVASVTSLLTDNRPSVTAVVPVSPWCILHSILFRVEQRDPAIYLEEDTIPASILILQFAHEQLSRRGSCTLSKGKLLLYTLDSLLPVATKEAYSDHENLKHCIEQAIFCLYGHPTKISKIRYLNDHSSPAISLDLLRSYQLYNYFRPKNLPEFDSYNSISESEATLFHQILNLIPPEDKPEEDFENLKRFLKGEAESLLEREAPNNFDSRFRDIFYLLGDHYFKIKEWTKSTEFYTWDLALKPTRFDSWAAIALAKAERITTQLNSCDPYNIMDVMSSANVAIKCFQNALELDPLSSKLRIEFGSFLYSMHSFCSRLLKQNTDQLSLEHFDLIEAKKEEFLERSTACFEPVASSNATNGSYDQHEELWIHHYMLGKVMEKLDPHSPEAFLEQYELAGKVLHEHGALYPMKISYYAPQELAIEALEIFYRIHASILNYVEKHEYSEQTERALLSYIERAAEGPFMKAKLRRPDSNTETKRKKQEKALAEVKALLEEMVEDVEKIVKEDNVVLKESLPSPSSQTSSNSTDDSSDSSSDEDSNSSSQAPANPVSFSLSAFQEKLREKEQRERKLAEAAKLLEDKKKAELSKPEAIAPIPEEQHFGGVKYGKILWNCVRAMKECIARFPTHHKSYFRISSTYSIFCKAHLKISRDWLLGTSSSDKKIAGLFGDRKPSNFFNGIWRNPIDDIDRPGSFPYHMAKTVQNLLEVLSVLNDHEMLTEIGIQLAKIPDPDKKYLYNLDREQFSQQAISSAIGAAKRLLKVSQNSLQDVAMGIYSSYLKLQKSNFKENGMGAILVEAYKLHLISKGMTPENLTVEIAVKHYQHLSWTTKLKASQSQAKRENPVGAHPGKECRRHSEAGKLAGTKRSFLGKIRNQASAVKKSDTTATVSAPHLMPQVSLFSALLNSSAPQAEMSFAGLAKKKSSLKPAALPATAKPTSTEGSSRLLGKEIPNLLSFPGPAENYLQQLGVMYGLQHMPLTAMTSAAASSIGGSNTLPAISKESSLLTSTAIDAGNEEFIIPDLNTSPTRLWMSSPWNTANMKTTTQTSSHLSSRKPTSADDKVKDFNLQSAEAIAKFQNTKSLWEDSPNTNTMSRTSSNQPYTSKLNELGLPVSHRQKSSNMPSKVKSRRASDVALEVNRRPKGTPDSFYRARLQNHTTTLQRSPTGHSGSIFVEGEKLSVGGYRGDSIQGEIGAQLPKAGKDGYELPLRRQSTSEERRKLPPLPRLQQGRNISESVPEKRKPSSRPRATSPSILRSPPTSIPLSTISTFNTSPFKAQSVMVSNPGQYMLPLPEILIFSRGASSPPAAHSANKTPPHATGGDNNTEIIDLTTKTPVKLGKTNVTPSVLPNFEEHGSSLMRGAKRPPPQMIPIDFQPQPEPLTCHSLPPKKKLAMRRAEETEEQRVAPAEIITID